MRRRAQESPNFFYFLFLEGGRLGEMGAQSAGQIGRRCLPFSLVSEEGIFQSATPQCCGKIILGSPGNARQGRAELLLLVLPPPQASCCLWAAPRGREICIDVRGCPEALRSQP
uniref:Uncharacterized protein n=1 Tax=Oryctolagus cuniculus TaxID=9986 RepID=A0A5F9C957_RABIT